jgi:hypothetical protein
MFLVRNMLELWGAEEAGKHLIDAFEKAGSTMFLAEQFTDRGRELRVFSTDSTEPATISMEDFTKLGEILLAKLKLAEAEGTLAHAAYYFSIARAWAHVAGAEDPKQWLSNGMLQSGEFMAKAARGLVSYSLGTPVRRYTMRDKPDPDLFDLDILLEAGRKHLTGSGLNDDQRNIIAAIVRGSQHLKQGRSSEGADLEREGD